MLAQVCLDIWALVKVRTQPTSSQQELEQQHVLADCTCSMQNVGVLLYACVTCKLENKRSVVVRMGVRTRDMTEFTKERVAVAVGHAVLASQV